MSPERQAMYREKWGCDQFEEWLVCLKDFEEEQRRRAMWECDYYESSEDCKQRYFDKQMAGFIAQNCHAGEALESCQERFRAEAIEQATKPARLQLGCHEGETLERCMARIGEEARPQYFVWLA